MNWLYYLLEANLYLLLFYGFYRLLLQQETFYTANRYYLIFSSAIAFLVPLIQIGILLPIPIKDIHLANSNIQINDSTVNYTDYLNMIYLSIAFLFVIKLCLNLFKIINLYRNAKKHKNDAYTLVELSNDKAAFSFFKLLFIHPQLAEKQAVLKHEMVHIKQKHSLDILYFEILQIISWFNPICYFLKKDIKLIHEFIADEQSTDTAIQKHEYAMFLIENSFGIIPTPLTNQLFNQSILKRRINMLNKKRTTKWARLKLLFMLPLTVAMLCISTLAFTKDYGYLDLLPEKSKLVKSPKQGSPKKAQITPTDTLKKKIVRDKVKFPPPIVKPDGKNLKTPPPVEPPPPSLKAKNDQVKFPPPIVKPDRKNLKTPPPVEPPPPSLKAKKDQVKFPPPIVKPAGKNNDKNG